MQTSSPHRVAVRRRRKLVATLVAGVTLLGACSSKSSTTAAPGGNGAGGANVGKKVDNAATVLGAAKKATGTPVKVGVFNVEGGSTVSLPGIGDAAVAAAQFANEHLGGLGGHPIEIDRCADKGDGASATACGNQFVQDKVVAVVSGQPSQADQLVPTVAGAKIPYFGSSPVASTEVLTKGLYFVSPGFLGSLAAWADYAKTKGYKKFGIVVVDNPQATAALGALGGPLFKKAGVTLAVTTVPQGTADASTQVQAALAKTPDVIGMVGDSTVCQAVLSALKASSSTIPKIGISPCLNESVLTAVGTPALEGMVIFENGDAISDQPEAKLYRAVMQTYAPKSDAGGLSNAGYLSMLSFVRAANAGGLTGDVTASSVGTALAAAKSVPMPLGDGQTFSCDVSAMAGTVIASTICNSKLFLTTVKSGKESPSFTVVDSAPLFKQK
ncbi:MAG: Branched-chain amino acid transport system substrate-binding protein [Acidimicrobiales bacterium]|nr:Branched-chain amino acid transport system substrate-binding protein [Acidimicrobiales bacterium]